MDKKREKTLKVNTLYSGKVLTYYVNDVLCPNGKEAKREYVTHPGGVCVLPILNNKIIMEKQFRYPFDQVLLELPAGKLNKGEDPIEAAKRELEEETGYRCEKLISLGAIYPSVGYTNEIIHLYAADELFKSEQNLDEDEILDVVYMDKDEVLKMIENDQIRDAKTIIALLKYFKK